MSERPEIFKNLKLVDPNKEVVFCKKCVLSNQRPRLLFNEQGVCVVCLFSEDKKKHIEWDKKENELKKLFDKFRKNDRRWI